MGLKPSRLRTANTVVVVKSPTPDKSKKSGAAKKTAKKASAKAQTPTRPRARTTVTRVKAERRGARGR